MRYLLECIEKTNGIVHYLLVHSFRRHHRGILVDVPLVYAKVILRGLKRNELGLCKFA